MGCLLQQYYNIVQSKTVRSYKYVTRAIPLEPPFAYAANETTFRDFLKNYAKYLPIVGNYFSIIPGVTDRSVQTDLRQDVANAITHTLFFIINKENYGKILP